MRALRSALLWAAIAWAIALVLAPLAASWPRAAAPWYAFALAAYAAGSVICHQLPERSFHLWAAQMPVCARCTGIYFGAALAATACSVIRLKADIPGGGAASTDAAGYVRRALLLAALPTMATLGYEWTTGAVPANWIRALAGVPMGVAVAWIIGAIG